MRLFNHRHIKTPHAETAMKINIAFRFIAFLLLFAPPFSDHFTVKSFNIIAEKKDHIFFEIMGFPG